jgi:hypothetical protein
VSADPARHGNAHTTAAAEAAMQQKAKEEHTRLHIPGNLYWINKVWQNLYLISACFEEVCTQRNTLADE